METCWREFVVEKYALRHLFDNQQLREKDGFSLKKVFRMFGVYAVKQ